MNFKLDTKAILLDFDGTLIDFNYNASEYTYKALDALRDSNYAVCLSSGRPVFLAKKAFEEKFGDYPLAYIFGCNGSEMMDVKNDKTEIIYPLLAEDVRYLGKTLDIDFLMLGIYEGNKFLVNHYRNTIDTNSWVNARWLEPVEYDIANDDKNRSKVIIISDKEDRDREDIFLRSKDLSKYSWSYSSPYCCEIVPKGVSKSVSVKKLCEIFNCNPEQIISFGDMENDLPMLVNSSGVAMGNAVDAVKSQTKYITDDVDKMGIYKFLHDNGLI